MAIQESLERINKQRTHEVSAPYDRHNAVLNLSIGIATVSIDEAPCFIIGMQGNPIYSSIDRNAGRFFQRDVYALCNQAWRPVLKNSRLWEFLQNHFTGEADLPIPWENNRVRHVVVMESSRYSVPTYAPRPIHLDLGIPGETNLPGGDGWWHSIAQRDFSEFFVLVEQLLKQRSLEEQRSRGEGSAELLRKIEEIKKSIEKTNLETEKETLSFKSALSAHENLTEIQNQAKFSNVYVSSDIATIINGGAGTGKTTTVIQRLKYLLSPTDLKDREVQISSTQSELLDNRNWVFFSPSDMLRQFLHDAMHHEGLVDAEDHSFVWKDYLNRMLADDYGVLNGFSSVSFDNQPSRNVFNNAFRVMDSFKKDFVDYASSQLEEDVRNCFNSDGERERIHSLVSSSFSNVVDICRGCINLMNYAKDELRSVSNTLEEEIKTLSSSLTEQILNDDKSLSELFALRVPSGQITIQGEKEKDNFKKDERIVLIKAIEKQLQHFSDNADWETTFDPALSEKDKQTRRFVLSKLQNIVTPEIMMRLLSKLEYKKMHQVFLDNYFEKLLSEIPIRYKQYRSSIPEGDDSWNQSVLRDLRRNNVIYQQEKSLIFGFINKCCHAYYYAARDSFINSKNKIVRAYQKNTFCVIGIDEATDYSLMDYFAIKSLMRPEKDVITSFTLSGDFTQRLGYFFIESWQSLTDNNGWIFKKVQETSLTTSFRQSRKLNSLAASLYMHLTGREYPYKSAGLVNDIDPISYCHSDFDSRMNWLCEQIIIMKEKSDDKLFSTAVFTPDEESAYKVHRGLVERLGAIHIGDDRILLWPNLDMSIPDRIRVLPISAVKGTEFPAVFLFDIDTLEDTDMALRYLYVGVTRANLYFGVASSSENEYTRLATENIYNTSWEE